MYNTLMNILNYIIDKLIDWILPLDKLNPISCDDEASW